MKRQSQVSAAHNRVLDLLWYARHMAGDPGPDHPGTPGQLRLEAKHPEETMDVRLDPYAAMDRLRVQAQTLSWVLVLDPEFDSGDLPGDGPVDT